MPAQRIGIWNFNHPVNYKLHQALGISKSRDLLWFPDDPRLPAQLEGSTMLKIEKEQTRMRVRTDIPQGLKHLVARIIGKDESRRFLNLYKAWKSSTMRGVCTP